MECGSVRRAVWLAALRHCALAVLATVVLVTAARAHPLNAKTIADVQCLIVGTRPATSSDQRVRLSGEMIAAYFLGRVDSRSSSADLEALLRREATKMTASEFRNAAQRCGTEFAARGAEITRIGKRLEKVGR